MNKKSYSLLILTALLAVGCNNNNTSSSTDNVNSSSSQIEDSSSLSTSSDISSSSEKYETINDVSKLFETYKTDSDYNYIVDFKYDVVQSREYIGGDEKEYLYDGKNLQIDFEYNGSNFVDYLVYDEQKSSWVYYLDDGTQKGYQYLD